MKNGIALRGHRRVLTLVGTPATIKNRKPSGGWRAGCICGWDGGEQANSRMASRAYRTHLETVANADTRICRRCEQEKPAGEFLGTNSRHICRTCWSNQGNEWQQQHPVEAIRLKRHHQLLKRFGLTLVEAEAMLVKQKGLCAICAVQLSYKAGTCPHVDHDHSTSKVRGILCFNCNAGLGAFKDSVARLQCAIDYLDQTGTAQR